MPRGGGAPIPEELRRLRLGTQSPRAGWGGCCAQAGAGSCKGRGPGLAHVRRGIGSRAARRVPPLLSSPGGRR